MEQRSTPRGQLRWGLERLGRGCAAAAVALVLGVAPAFAVASGHDAPARSQDRLVLYVPATEGGGWDQTAIALKRTLEAEGLAHDVAIVHRPGAGGLVGLTQFVDARRGDSSALIVGGLGMIYSAKANASAVTPLNATPIARLARDYYVVAVPARSRLHTVQDLIAKLTAQPGTLHWAGDQPAGAAQRVIWQIAAAAHLDPLTLPYLPRFGSGEVATLLLQQDPDLVAVAGYGELAPALAGGGIRILGIAAGGSSFDRVPTLRAQGLNIVAANWSGVFAAPDLHPEQRRRLIGSLTSVAHSAVWRNSIRRHGWQDDFLAGDDFADFLADEHRRVFASVIPPDGAAARSGRPARFGWLWPTVAALVAVLTAGLWAYGTGFWRGRAWRRQRQVAVPRAPLGGLDASPGASPAASPVAAVIDREFDGWKLSAAERDVAWFLLKGLPMKEIARLRGASERTVRQQARAVYSKADLEGRSDLAGRILDECLAPATGTEAL